MMGWHRTFLAAVYEVQKFLPHSLRAVSVAQSAATVPHRNCRHGSWLTRGTLLQLESAEIPLSCKDRLASRNQHHGNLCMPSSVNLL